MRIFFTDNKQTSFYKNVSIFSFVLMQPSMIVDEIMTNIGFSQKIGFLLLFINIFLIAVLSYGKVILIGLQRKIKLLLSISLGYLIILEFSVDYSVGISTAIRNLLVAILILVIINNKGFNIRRLTNFFILVAFTLSLLSLLQYIGYSTNIYNFKSYTYNTYSHDTVLMGFGGFADTFSWGQLYRNQSFFIEPARFAQFLIIPIFISLLIYINNGTKRNLFILITILVAFILTFSVANYFGLLLGLLIVSLFLKKQLYGSKYKIFYRFLLLGLSVIVIYAGIQLFGYTDEHKYYRQSGIILGKSSTNSFIERSARFDIAKSAVEDNFFGNRSIRKLWSRNPGAVGLLLIVGGIPLVFISLLYSGYFYFYLFRLLRKSSFTIIYAGSMAYFISFNWYGSYYEMIFLFQILLITTYVKYEQQGKKIF